MTHADKEKKAQIGGDDNVIWWFMMMGLLELPSRFMGRLVPIIVVWAKSELQMVSKYGLF